MNKIKYLILGNGFDRAHNMETRYQDFLRFLFEDQKQEIPKIIKEPLFTEALHDHNIDEVVDRLQNNSGLIQEHFKNIFYKMALLDSNPNGFWADLEALYLKLLKDTAGSYSPSKLNLEFKIITDYLELYLDSENKKERKLIPFFTSHFSNNKYAAIINLNYTNTIELYNPKSKIIYLHGKLFDKANPIIFGNGTNDDDYNFLLNLNNDEYLSFIKNSRYYAQSDLKNLLSQIDEFSNMEHLNCSVELLGVSCGFSDYYFLSALLKKEAIKEINIWHYEGNKTYFDIKHNLDRILRSGSDRNKINPYNTEFNIPQAV